MNGRNLLRAEMATISPGLRPSSESPRARHKTPSTNWQPVFRRSPEIVAGELWRMIDRRLKQWQMWGSEQLPISTLLEERKETQGNILESNLPSHYYLQGEQREISIQRFRGAIVVAPLVQYLPSCCLSYLVIIFRAPISNAGP